eukprot:TRINITY_DN1206_c10_g1_i1.p1 TRINITY_DN1206_c10_g1~~TRINITY_DN1206_c10_g1_i1.p1  ORF type:complete len:454 (+),score=48.60 TRINITY_DN1206_c10_g1_i1:44-1405(+)
MISPYDVLLLGLLLLYAVGWMLVRRLGNQQKAPQKRESEGDISPTIASGDEFRKFQTNYLIVYCLVMFSDWLKGPYVYALYHAYGYDKGEIANLYIAGFMSSLVCGTYCGAIADRFGRRRLCYTFCIVYALSAMTKLVNDYNVLMLGRILAGIATSLLSTTFESWMVSEHLSRGYAQHLLMNTFAWATQLNGIMAVAAGVAASTVAELYGFAAPFVLAIAPLSIVFLLIALTWGENFGDREAAPFAPAITAIRNDFKLFCLGAAQSAFDTGLFLWVFLWTPALNQAASADNNLPYGRIFSSFMACTMIGSLVYELTSQFKQFSSRIPYLLHVLPCCCALVPLLSTSYPALLTSFLLFEVSCGIFFPCYATLRAAHLPEETRAAVSNFFRVPMNLFVCVLLFLGAQRSLDAAFFVLFVTHVVGVVCCHKFVVAEKLDKDMRFGDQDLERSSRAI